VTQAVLLGQADLAAGYKMDHRMSPRKGECSWQSRPGNRRVKIRQQKRKDVKIWTEKRWAVIAEGRKKENAYLDVDRLQAK